MRPQELLPFDTRYNTIMKVNLDRYRIFHLIVLLACSFVVAETLIAKMEWTKMSAYGLAITITTQLSNAINSANKDADAADESAAEKKRQEKRERVLEKRRERRNGQPGITNNKKRK